MNELPFPPNLPNDAPKTATVIHRIATVVLWIAYIVSMFILSACNTNHSVTQSVVNKETGDSIVIRYEQIGNFKKLK